MKPAEYERMYHQEDSYWWFVGRHGLILRLLEQRFRVSRSSANAGPRHRTDLRILDVGCGTGAMSTKLQRFGQVISADMSPLALSFSRRRGLTALCSADAVRLPFASGSFDAVVALDLLEHIEDDGAAVREFGRVLKPGARLYATVPAYQSLWSAHDLALMHHRRYVAPQLRALVERNGMTVRRLSYAMTALFPVVWLIRRMDRRSADPQATVMPVPALANALLQAVLAAENAVLQHVDLPFGVTVLCIAEAAA